MAEELTYLFNNTKQPIGYEKYTLSRGVSDFSNMAQWNRFEKGYYFLVVVDIPDFLKELAKKSTAYANLINTYVHILEYEFKGLSGLEDMTGETAEISDGISSVNMINKVNFQSASTFSMNYNERSGSILTKVNQLFLTGIKDPRTQIKTYHGLVGFDNDTLGVDKSYALYSPNGNRGRRPGWENEVFKFLYFNTDNTAKAIENAYYIVSAQPTKAELSIYAGDKGSYDFPELSMEFSGYPIIGSKVNSAAMDILKAIHKGDAASKNGLAINSNDFAYDALEKGTHSTQSTIYNTGKMAPEEFAKEPKSRFKFQTGNSQ